MKIQRWCVLLVVVGLTIAACSNENDGEPAAASEPAAILPAVDGPLMRHPERPDPNFQEGQMAGTGVTFLSYHWVWREKQ